MTGATPSTLVPQIFYDLGPARHEDDSISSSSTAFTASLAQLQQLPIDKRREVLLVDVTVDHALVSLISNLRKQFEVEGVHDCKSIESQVKCLRTIAMTVTRVMGGPVGSIRELEALPVKFHVAELKTQFKSNVLPIGFVHVGTFYHRALLFKALVDALEVAGGCSLVRGEYGRAWNTVFMRKNQPQLHVDSAIPPSAQIIMEGQVEVEFLVDLMFRPGDLLNTTTDESISYQRIQ